mgnify:CR=1 FL=1
MITTQSRVFVDGALIGLVDDPKELVAKIRSMRRQGVISTEVNCSYKEFNGDIIIHTDRGRARRPLIVLENGIPTVPDEEVQKLKNKSDKDHHLKHLASIVRNPASIRNIEKNKKIQDQQKAEKQRIENEYEKAKAPDPNVGYIEVALRNDETTNQSVNKGISELGREDLAFGTITRIQEILIKAIEKPKEYKLKEDEIILLSKLLMIVNSEFFTVSYVRGTVCRGAGICRLCRTGNPCPRSGGTRSRGACSGRTRSGGTRSGRAGCGTRGRRWH